MSGYHVSLIALIAFISGCMSLRANVPEEVVRGYARKDGVEIAASCARDGRSYSEGAVVCMVDRRMACSGSGRWVNEGSCEGVE